MPVRLPFCLLVALLPVTAVRADPDCAGPDRWPAAMTFVQLKNAGLIGDGQTDPARTTSKLLASQKIGPDRYRQIFKVTIFRKTGAPIRAIAESDASSTECSMSAVTVYPVSEALGQ